jgi:hypothetical protein
MFVAPQVQAYAVLPNAPTTIVPQTLSTAELHVAASDVTTVTGQAATVPDMHFQTPAVQEQS